MLRAWFALVASLGGAPASEPATPRVVSFGEASNEEFARAWGAATDHLRASAFTAQSEALPVEATRTERAKALAAEDPGLVAVFWWTRDEAGYQLFAFDPRQGLYLRRSIAVAEGEEAAALESLAVIIATTAEALRFGETVAMNEATADELAEAEERLDAEAEPAPEPDTPEPDPEASETVATPVTPGSSAALPREERRLIYDLALAYLGESLAKERLWASGGAARFRLGHRSGWGGLLHYGYLAPARFSLAPAEGDGRSSQHRVAALLSYRRAATRRLDWQLGLGPQLEVWSWDANGVGGVRPHFRLLVEAGLRVQIAGPVYLLCNLFGASAVAPLDFVVCANGESDCSGSQRQVVFTPFWVRGGAELGAGLRF